MIVALSGKLQSGKDLTGSIIQYLSITKPFPHLSFEDFRKFNIEGLWEVKRFAGKVKQIASILTGIPVADFEKIEVKNSKLGPEWNYMTVRELLQKLGTDAIRDKLHLNAWVNALFSDYQPSYDWIITDMRFGNELCAVKERGGITIRLTRNVPASFKIANHISETALDHASFDFVIENNGTVDDLILNVRDIMIKEKLI